MVRLSSSDTSISYSSTTLTAAWLVLNDALRGFAMMRLRPFPEGEESKSKWSLGIFFFFFQPLMRDLHASLSPPVRSCTAWPAGGLVRDWFCQGHEASGCVASLVLPGPAPARSRPSGRDGPLGSGGVVAAQARTTKTEVLTVFMVLYHMVRLMVLNVSGCY